jgi:hypothetical protein
MDQVAGKLNTRQTGLVGCKFYPGSFEAIKSMPYGTVVELRREPSNPYDANAISVWYNDKQLGHLPRGMAVYLAKVMDEGTNLRCTRDKGVYFALEWMEKIEDAKEERRDADDVDVIW